MKKTLLTVAALALCATSTAFAEPVSEGNYLVRARGVFVNPVNSDSANLGVNVSDKLIPELDLSYFFTPNIAAELILTVPQKLDVNIGNTKIGTVKALPPVLLAQYHFTGLSVRPYIGAGLNYTRFSHVELGGLEVSRNSFGPALQAGVDIPLGKNWLINLDVKKTWLKTDVRSGGATVTTLKVDPWLLGVGVGYRF